MLILDSHVVQLGGWVGREKPAWTGAGEGLGVAEGQDEEPLLTQPLPGGKLLRMERTRVNHPGINIQPGSSSGTGLGGAGKNFALVLQKGERQKASAAPHWLRWGQDAG